MKSPFKFLDAYYKEDKDIYFGRDLEIDDLYDRIFETNLVLLYGASGTGKTSLINCGLANRFENTDWHPIFVRRKDNVLQSFSDELNKHAIKPFDSNLPYHQKIRSLYLDYFKPIYVVFDQFEEIFIMGTREEQDQFFMMIRDLLNENTPCKIILSMREEYIAHMYDFERVIPPLFDNRLRIERMNRRNIEEVILGTVKAFGIDIQNENATCEAIINNLRDKQGNIDLANLQVYLDRLYQIDATRRGEESRTVKFDPDLVTVAGELDDVLALFLTQQVELLEAELVSRNVKQKNVPMDILFSLVTDSATKQPMDKTALRSYAIEKKNIPADAVDYCLKRFMEMRIIREIAE